MVIKYIKQFKASRQLPIIAAVLALIALSFAVRVSLVKFLTPDAKYLEWWYMFVQNNGIHSFQSVLTNYGPPYPYFLYIASLLHLSPIAAVKSIPWFFDLVLAGSVYQLVKVLRPGKYVPLGAAIFTLFVPTVLLTGVFWGQFDQFYTAFLLLSLAAGVSGKSRWAWALFGVAFAIKLQAVFFLPILGILSFKKVRWYDAVWSLGSYLVLTLPPLLAGRSLSSLLNIYPGQAKVFSGILTLNAPNVYQWFPNSLFNYLNGTGIALALAAAFGIVLLAFIYRKYSGRELLLATTLMLYVVPFLLPAMHERYFFPAGVVSIVLFVCYPTALNLVSAVTMQVVTIFSYMPYLFNRQPPIAMPILSVAVLFVICGLFWQYLAPKPRLAVSRRL